MLLRCPDCDTLMRPKPPEGTKEGAKVGLTCRCGTRLRFTMPGKPKPLHRPAQFTEVDDLLSLLATRR